MENCQHNLQTDPLTGGHITLQGVGFFKVEKCQPEKVKCDHGLHIPISERSTGQSSYCGACNPDTYTDAILFRSMSKRRPPSRHVAAERVMDAVEFINQPADVRLRALGA